MVGEQNGCRPKISYILCFCAFVRLLVTIRYRCKKYVQRSLSHRSPDIDQIAPEVIKAGARIIRYQIHNLIICI